ncbi:expressed unknown protein [Seminavis robusta]|uniref:Uncharacterized protein n=1 Tax=Seminavis robusta TaxID=568900 RepID=A0A9N8HIK5_9STRA|nr:expressed unknown protein [Seminavis robusta]|eukprot:Sro601_g173550.1 n/a (498) ;mRNA; f:34442-35935
MSTTTNTTHPIDDSSHTNDCGFDHHHSNDNDDGPIWYFGYGPIVHPSVRQRRGIRVTDEQPAVLRDHRLTFAFGGIASLVAQTGYDIHGIVMRCETESDWEKLKEQEAGFHAAPVNVHPYRRVANFAYDSEVCPLSPELDDNDDDDDDEDSIVPPIKAYAFVMDEFDKDKLDRPIEKLPQERYLRLIAAGMYKYNGDEDYIESEIMGVPFSPSRKPHEYLTFPNWNHNNEQTKGTVVYSAADKTLPSITYSRYKDFCRQTAFLMMGDGLNNASVASVQSASTSSGDSPQYTSLCFIVGNHVVWVPQHDPKHAGARWLRKYGFAKEDVSYMLHTFVIDPDIPYCETPAQVSPPVQNWAENQLVISVAQGLDAYRTLKLVEDSAEESPDIESVLARLLQSTQPGMLTVASSVTSMDSATSSPRPRGRTRQMAGSLIQNAFRRAGNRMRTSTTNSHSSSVTDSSTTPAQKQPDKSASLSPTRRQGRRRRWSLQMRKSPAA